MLTTKLVRSTELVQELCFILGENNINKKLRKDTISVQLNCNKKIQNIASKLYGGTYELELTK